MLACWFSSSVTEAAVPSNIIRKLGASATAGSTGLFPGGDAVAVRPEGDYLELEIARPSRCKRSG